MRDIIRVMAGLFLLLGMTACDGTIFRTFDLKSGQSISIDARQRLVLVGDRQIARRQRDGTLRHDQVVCTEPSPDAMVAKAAAIAGSATSPEVAASLGASFSESAANIGIRTPTIQLLRDGMFRACEAYLNGAIDKEEYSVILFNYDRIMTALIIVDAMGAFKLSPNVAITAGGVNVDTSGKVTSNISKTQKEAEAEKSLTVARTGEAAGKAGAQPGSMTIGTVTGGYTIDPQAAQGVRDVLLRVAELMLTDNGRYGLCVTPPENETINIRNRYFRSICDSIDQIVAQRVTAARLANQMRERCVRAPTMPVCARLTWQ